MYLKRSSELLNKEPGSNTHNLTGADRGERANWPKNDQGHGSYVTPI